jgi:hypothetical protein
VVITPHGSRWGGVLTIEGLADGAGG